MTSTSQASRSTRTRTPTGRWSQHRYLDLQRGALREPGRDGHAQFQFGRDPTTSYLYLTYDLSPSAVQATQGMAVRGPSDIFPTDGQIASFPQINSSTVPVNPSTDELDLLHVNDPAGGFSAPAVATQGNKNVPS